MRKSDERLEKKEENFLSLAGRGLSLPLRKQGVRVENVKRT